jgi:mannosyltransferase OCH1-like enzyme
MLFPSTSIRKLSFPFSILLVTSFILIALIFARRNNLGLKEIKSLVINSQYSNNSLNQDAKSTVNLNIPRIIHQSWKDRNVPKVISLLLYSMISKHETKILMVHN